MGDEPQLSASCIVRTLFGAATIVFLGLAVAVGSEPRLFAAATAFGVIWTLWDLVIEYVVAPLGDWVTQVVVGGGVGMPRANTRPTLDDTIRLLESHLARGASRQVEVNAAVRLEEIYRTVKKDPVRARAVIARVRERHPDAPELARFVSDNDHPAA